MTELYTTVCRSLESDTWGKTEYRSKLFIHIPLERRKEIFEQSCPSGSARLAHPTREYRTALATIAEADGGIELLEYYPRANSREQNAIQERERDRV